MSTTTFPIGTFSAGLLYASSSSSFQTLPAGPAGSYVFSNGIGSFLSNNTTIAHANSSSVAQRLLASPTPVVNPSVGDGSTPYTPANELCNVVITPASSASIILIEFNISCVEFNAIGDVAAYANGATVPAPLFSTQVNATNVPAATTITTPAVGRGSVLASAYASPITVSLCAYSNGAPVTIGQAGDYLVVTEIVDLVAGAMNAVVVSSSATPVLAFSVNLPANTSTQILGYISCIDSANATTNLITFNLVALQGASGSSSIGGQFINSILPTPSLSWVTGSNIISAYVVGQTGSTYTCQYSYQTVT